MAGARRLHVSRFEAVRMSTSPPVAIAILRYRASCDGGERNEALGRQLLGGDEGRVQHKAPGEGQLRRRAYRIVDSLRQLTPYALPAKLIHAHNRNPWQKAPNCPVPFMRCCEGGKGRRKIIITIIIMPFVITRQALTNCSPQHRSMCVLSSNHSLLYIRNYPPVSPQPC